MSYDRLPMHRRSSSASKYRFNLNARHRAITFLKFFIPAAVLLILYGVFIYEPHVEIAFYERGWVYREIEPIKPLAGCFHPERVSAKYNVSEALYGPKYTDPQAGVRLRFGMDCYDLAGTIRSPPKSPSRPTLPPDERTQFHTYWRIDLAEFGPRQEYMLKSFFATQDLRQTRLVLWSNGDLAEGNRILQTYLKTYPNAFAVRKLSIPELAKGTILEGHSLLTSKDKKAWLDGDLIRLLLLWNYGGVWIDMDSLLTRDLEPLLEHEFVTQWDCYDKKYSALNGALMRFRQHSPYLCEAFNIMLNDTPPREDSTDWGSILYLKLWRRLVAASIPPFKILPFCFSDGRSCRLDNRLPDPFVSDDSKGKWTMGLGIEEGGALDMTLHEKVFSVHLHNQWEKEFPRNGWVERLLIKGYDKKVMSHREAEIS
ncbi:hypothetical protein D9758_011460 [Tetrapyrgos nigripes]|uniref:Glycosyltransferase family 32 protein n=1 Tax=Tetrapyrgos nigripes TaxID=182062 RepID=A0A8H5CQ52_9AGAR|nr:hypothetical protein D9758_011460 [Tetrapyrgos nigripes]